MYPRRLYGYAPGLDPSRALAGAILKTDETTLAIKAEGGRIGARAQGWDEARALGADEVLEIVAVGNQLYFFARPRPLAYKNADPTGLSGAGYGPATK